MGEIMQEEYLAHHGVLGQKWGVRRYQNPDGTLTEEGRRRVSKAYANAHDEYVLAKSSLKKAGPRKYNESYDKASVAKTNFQRVKAAESKKSKHQLSLEQHYEKKGMSKEDAELAAYKRAKTEKILLAVGGMTIATAAAYVAYRHYEDSVDKIIPAGKVLKRIASSSDAGVHDAFYAAGKIDANKYLGLWGLNKYRRGLDVYQKDITVKTGIKLASKKSAMDVLTRTMASDPSFKNDVLSIISNHVPRTTKEMVVKAQAMKAVKNGTINSAAYDLFNINIPHVPDTSKTFYDALKSHGYSAIKDINDNRYSGFGAKTATIFFDAGKVSVTKVSKKSLKDMVVPYAVHQGKTYIKQLAPYAVGIVGYNELATSHTDKVNSNARKKTVIRNYRSEHPDSKLTDSEILNNYYGLNQKG